MSYTHRLRTACICSLAAMISPWATAQADTQNSLNYSAFRQAARELVTSGHVTLRQPRIEEKSVGNRVYLKYGFLSSATQVIPEVRQTTPFSTALDHQLRVEAIRAYRNSPSQQAAWNEALGEVESLIGKLLQEQGGRDWTELDKDERETIIALYDQRIEAVYHTFLDANARRQGLLGAKRDKIWETYTTDPSDTFDVTIESDPKNAQIVVFSRAYARAFYNSLSDRNDNTRLKHLYETNDGSPISGKTSVGSGKKYFVAKWPDGRFGGIGHHYSKESGLTPITIRPVR